MTELVTMATSRLYIAVREEVPDFMVPTLVAHTILGADTFFHENTQEVLHQYLQWKTSSFRKCVVKVNKKEWWKIETLPVVYFGYEKTVYDGQESCAIPLPCLTTQVPNVLKFAKLWAPTKEISNNVLANQSSNSS